MHSKILLANALLTLGASAQSSMNLTTLLASTPLLSSLVGVLKQYPDIAASLESATNVTIFAPYNKAIAAAVKSGGFPTEESAIQAVLDYHIVPDVIPSSAITRERQFVPTTLTDPMYTNVTGGQVIEIYEPAQIPVLITGLQYWSTVISADHEFDGGIVHIVDRVLTIPPDIATTAKASNLSALAGALVATDLLTTLEEASDITVFAPTNAAFAAIGSALGNLTTKQLSSILEYHVVQGTVAYSSTLESGSVATLHGEDINITVEDGAIFINSARVINPDVLIPGGVLHVIDSVLNPANSDESPPSATASTIVDAWPSASSAPLGGLTSGMASASGSASTSSAMAPAASSGGAVMPTGAIGAAALFGGAALAANW